MMRSYPVARWVKAGADREAQALAIIAERKRTVREIRWKRESTLSIEHTRRATLLDIDAILAQEPFPSKKWIEYWVDHAPYRRK